MKGTGAKQLNESAKGGNAEFKIKLLSMASNSNVCKD